jgi:hypothetical protein
MPEALRAAVFGNVGNLVIFRVGPTDAAFLEPEFAPWVTPDELMNLKNYTALTKLTEAGHPERPLTVTTLPPELLGSTAIAAAVREASRRRYGANRRAVDTNLGRWMAAQ